MAETQLSATPDPADPTALASIKPRKKRRLVVKLLLALLVLLVLLVALLPTILSTAAVRSMVLGQVNKNLRGRVEAASWSIGWTGGIDARGIKLFDDNGKAIAQVQRLSTELPLTKAIFGKLPLGKVKIDGVTFDLVVDQNNQLNIAKLTKPSTDPADEKPTSASSKLPDISADVEITNVSGRLERFGKPAVLLTQAGGNIKIPGINEPITNDFNVTVKVGDGPEGRITTSGSAEVIKNNQLALSAANAQQTIDVKDVDLHALLPFLAGAGIDHLAGATVAHLALDVKAGKAASLDVNVQSRGVVVAGPALKGDSFATQSLTAIVPKMTAVFPDGLDNWQSGRIKVGADGAPPIDLTFDQGRLTAIIDLVPQALLNLKDNKKPGSSGMVKIEPTIDLGKLAVQMKNTFHIASDAAVTGGTIKQAMTLALTDDKADLQATTDVIGVSGQRAGKPIALQPIHVALGAIHQGGGGALPDLRDLNLELSSGFANGKFTGRSLADLSGSVKGELQKLQAELGQFVDFGDRQLAGGFDVAVNNRGDLTVPNGTARLDARATLTNLKVNDEVNQPWVEAKLTGDLHHGEQAFIDSAKNVVITLQTNNPQSPTVDIAADINADLTSAPKADFKLTKANVDLAKTQAEFGRFVPALGKNGIVLAAGNVSATASGSYNGTSKTAAVTGLVVAANHATIQKQSTGARRTEVLRDYTLNLTTDASADWSDGLALRIPKLDISDSQQMLAVQKPGEQLAVNRSPTGAISGSGQLVVHADLARVNRILTSLSNTEAVVTTTSAGDIRTGNLALKLALAPGDGGQTLITADGDVTGLRVATPIGSGDEPESMKITLRATGTPEGILSKQLSINSRFASAEITDAQLNLSKSGAAAGMLGMLQKAKLAIDVPDLKLTKLLLDAFSPPAAPVNAKSASASAPLPPLQFTGGSLSMRADVAHEGSSLMLNVSDISGKEIAFRRGEASYQAKPFNVQLVAAVDSTAASTATTQQIGKVQITHLSGNLGVATLSMPTPIVISDLSSSTPSASGAVKIDGKVQDVTQLLAALQAKAPAAYPYRGDFAVTQTVGSGQGGVSLVGGVQVAKLQVLRGSEVAFSEEQFTLTNDLTLAADANAVAIKTLSANMQSSGALNLSVQNGRIDDIKTARRMNLSLDLQYDLAKLWPIVHPMLLTPGQEDGYKDTQVAGQFKKSFHLTGEYPAGLPFNQAIRTVIADGNLAVGSLDHNGLKVQNLELPLTLRDGKATTVYHDKPAGQNTAPVATANDGQLDLGNITVDLTQEVMRVSTPPAKPLLAHATINPLFAKTYLAKVINNPLFVGTREATGVIDVSIVQCEQLPLSDIVLQRVPQNTGRATIKFSLTNLHIGGEGVGTVISKLFKGSAQDSFEANVKDATVSIANGVATQHINFQTGKYNLGFDGGVSLQSRQLLPLTVNVPLARIVQAIHNDPNIIRYVPDQAAVVMEGTLSQPQLRLDQLLARAVTDATAKALLGGVLPGAKSNAPATTNPSGAQPGNQRPANNPLGDLLDQLQNDPQRRQQPPKAPQRAPAPAPRGGGASTPAPAPAPATQPLPQPGANDPLGGLFEKLQQERQDRERRQQEQEQKRQQQPPRPPQ